MAVPTIPPLTTVLPTARPTELRLLLGTGFSSPRELLRLTFLDLLRQQVLQLEHRLQPEPVAPPVWHTYVRPGPALATYRPRAYEALLMHPFQHSRLPELLLGHFIRLLYERIQVVGSFPQLVRRQGPLFTLYRRDWWCQLLGLAVLTPEGKQLRQQLRQQLDAYDARLRQLLAGQPSAAAELATGLGGVLFLLPTFSSPLSRQLDQALYQTQAASWTDSLSSGFDSFSSSGSQFNSQADAAGCHDNGSHHSHDGDSGDGDSGCGGDSGCSGCGGCGGD